MTTSLELQHFAVLAITYAPAVDSVVITCVTNNLCHLWCYYTDKPPVRHATSRVVRGLALPWGAYWCFVAWNSVEQQEIGDTRFHTFQVPDWSYCQTRYFCFKGTVGGQPSPSASALFQYHHPGIPLAPIILRPNAPGDVCLLPGQNGPSCPNHYLNVDEDIPDEFMTDVQSPFYDYSLGYYDLYHIEHHRIPGPVVITNVRVYARTIVTDFDLYHPHGAFWIGLKTGPREDWSETKAAEAYWTDDYWDWPTNPFTGNPWTLEDIEHLQIGVGLTTPHMVPPKDYILHCTQLWAVISFT